MTKTWKADAEESAKCVFAHHIVETWLSRQTLVNVFCTGGATKVRCAFADKAIECVSTDASISTWLWLTLVDLLRTQSPLPTWSAGAPVAIKDVNAHSPVTALVGWGTVIYVHVTCVSCNTHQQRTSTMHVNNTHQQCLITIAWIQTTVSQARCTLRLK